MTEESFALFLETCISGFYEQDNGDKWPIFIPDDEEVTSSDIEQAEMALGIKLPHSYRKFLLTCGSGTWCGDWVPPPIALGAFDEDCWEMAGFVTLVHNVQLVGDFIAINPADPEKNGERPVYYCSHDPFGYARIAASFEDWCRKTLEGERTGTIIYIEVEDVVYAKWKEYLASQPKKCWQFWR